MKLSELGERRIINRIIPILNSYDTSNFPGKSAIEYGDDVSAIEFADRYLVVSSDMISRDSHIPPGATPWQIGFYSIAVNLSDIAAKGATPLGLMVAMGMPPDRSVSFLEEMTKGMADCAQQFNTSILGGDTKPNESLTLSVTVLGIVKKELFMPRRGGKKGDLIAVTGVLGEAARGFYSNDLKLLLEPMPCIEEGRALAKTGAVTSSMDISDGLANSLYQLSALNKLRYKIDLDSIPVTRKLKDFCSREGRSIEDMALNFGGDFQLLVTIDPSKRADVERALDGIFAQFTIIGEVVEEGVNPKVASNILIKDGQEVTLENKGYEHFRPNDSPINL